MLLSTIPRSTLWSASFWSKDLSAEGRARAAVERILALSKSGLLQTSVDPGSIRREDLYERKYSHSGTPVLAAAESGATDILFTEDLNHGQHYGRVLAQNPFLPA
jgi:hypothetical protein